MMLRLSLVPLRNNGHTRLLSKSNGVTLIELVICLALIMGLYFFSAGIDQSSYDNNQLQILKNEIQETIRYAKAQALADGVPLILEPLSPLHDWSDGAVLFEDNPTHTRMPLTIILRQWDWSKWKRKVYWYGFQSDHYLIVAPDVSHSVMNGYFMIQDKTHPTRVIVNRLGRVRIE